MVVLVCVAEDGSEKGIWLAELFHKSIAASGQLGAS